MSYHAWTVDGYGFCVEEIETTAENIRELLLCAPKFDREIKDWFIKQNIVNPDLDDYLEYDRDMYSGLAYILQNVIMEAEDIQIDIASDFNDEWYVLLCPTYPWSIISDKEKNLTLKSITKIFNKYIHILTDKPVSIDFQSIENGG